MRHVHNHECWSCLQHSMHPARVMIDQGVPASTWLAQFPEIQSWLGEGKYH
jgi:hypothetical protein